MSNKINQTTGRWRIIWMEMWDNDYIDMEVPAHITIYDKGNGSFQFGLVEGEFETDLEKTYIDGSWGGSDENDDASGEINAYYEEGELHGEIYFDNGDESEFRAVPF